MVPDPSAAEAPPAEESVLSPRGDTTAAAEPLERAPRDLARSWGSIMRAPRDLALPWGSIIDSVLSVVPEESFERLRSGLTLGADHVSYAHVAAALDSADRLYFEAVTLVRAAKLEEQRVDREIEMRLEVLRTSARTDIETEKRKAADEVKSKAVGRATIEEVKDRCRANWPDEVASLERRSQEHHAARAVAEELATAWRSRASSLRELIVGLRGR